MLALRLNSLHNLHHYLDLMRQAQKAIVANRFTSFASEVAARQGHASERDVEASVDA